MPAIVVIPSRYGSTRFPGKPLKSLLGKPLIQHVYEAVGKAKSIDGIFVATDSIEIFKTVEAFGGKAVMTSEWHQSGTDRIGEALLKIEADDVGVAKGDIIVNVQGDEPMIKPQMVDDLVEMMLDEDKTDMGTLAKRIDKIEDITNPNVVKVVLDRDDYALYFSRSPIPYNRDMFCNNILTYEDMNKIKMFKHIGIYAYKRDFLLKFIKMPKSFLEETEKLEQLRALENGYRIRVKITRYETIGVDTPEDLERVKKCLSISL